MKPRISVALLSLAGLVVLAGMAAGYAFGPLQQGERIWCTSQFLQPVTSGDQNRWLLARLNLDLSADGQGILRIRGRMLDANGTALAYMHRQATLHYRRNGPHLRLAIEHAGRSATDDLTDSQIPMVSLSLFQPGSVLSFHLARLGETAYLIDNGIGGRYYCKVTPAGPSPHLSSR